MTVNCSGTIYRIEAVRLWSDPAHVIQVAIPQLLHIEPRRWLPVQLSFFFFVDRILRAVDAFLMRTLFVCGSRFTIAMPSPPFNARWQAAPAKVREWRNWDMSRDLTLLNRTFDSYIDQGYRVSLCLFRSWRRFYQDCYSTMSEW